MAKRKANQAHQDTPPEVAATAAGEPFYETPPGAEVGTVRGDESQPLPPHYTDGRACDADMRLSAAKLVAKHLRIGLDAAKRTVAGATERQLRAIMRQQLAEHSEVEIRQILQETPGG